MPILHKFVLYKHTKNALDNQMWRKINFNLTLFKLSAIILWVTHITMIMNDRHRIQFTPINRGACAKLNVLRTIFGRNVLSFVSTLTVNTIKNAKCCFLWLYRLNAFRWENEAKVSSIMTDLVQLYDQPQMIRQPQHPSMANPHGPIID